MSQLIIEGGHRLQGTITASGNKNAALKLIPACLMTDEPVILHNLPDIADVRTALAIMRDLGAETTALGPGSWRIHAAEINKSEIDWRLASRIRAFQFRDIRPKAASELPLDHASKLLGHTEHEITEKVYRRVGEVVKPTK